MRIKFNMKSFCKSFIYNHQARTRISVFRFSLHQNETSNGWNDDSYKNKVWSQLAEMSRSGLVADPLQGSTYHLAAREQ